MNTELNNIDWKNITSSEENILPRIVAHQVAKQARRTAVELRRFDPRGTTKLVVNSNTDISLVLNSEPSIAEQTPPQLQSQISAQSINPPQSNTAESIIRDPSFSRNAHEKIREVSRNIIRARTYGDLKNIEGLSIDSATGKIAIKLV